MPALVLRLHLCIVFLRWKERGSKNECARLANNAVVKFVDIDKEDLGEVIFAWLEFPSELEVGQKYRIKVAGHVAALPKGLYRSGSRLP